MQTVRLAYFAWVRELMGRDEEAVAPPDDVVSIGQLVAWLAARDANGAAAFADRSRIRCARDGVMVSLDCAIADATEIALFPPVTGG
jgi:sulfur-carrier protein